MKHQIPQEITATATTYTLPDQPRMSRRERLERWAGLLESHGGALNALRQIEYLAPDERRAYSAPNTPLTIAYNDSVLRREGLKSDGLGDVMEFFEMSDADAHRLLCDCRYLGRMTGPAVARNLRRYTARQEARGSVMQAIGRFFGFAPLRA